MIIAAKIICAHTKRVCDSCFNGLGDLQARLYGAAEYGDKPYVIYVHPECMGEEARAKLKSKPPIGGK